MVVDRARGAPEILHFDATGTYIDGHLREGEGPGETLRPQTVLAVGDSLWWRPVERFRMDVGPDGRSVPIAGAGERQVMSGPLLFDVGISDGIIWTASYVYTRRNRQYADFLNDWLGQGLQADAREFIEALTPQGELVASAVRDDLAPPRFTSGGLMYTLDKEGHGTGMTLYEPGVIHDDPTNKPSARRTVPCWNGRPAARTGRPEPAVILRGRDW